MQRVQLLEQPTRRAVASGHRMTLPQVVGISGNASTQDLRGVQVLPDLLKALGPVTDPKQAQVVAALRSWVASGAHRRDTTAKGYDDDSAAVLAFDAWWRAVVHDVYDPQLGSDVVALVQDKEDLVLDARAVTTGFFDGWHSQLSSVVRAALSTHDSDAPTGTSCGTGTLASCRALLKAALTKAVATLQASQGTDPATWRKPVLCPDDPTPTCDENRPLTAGALATPSHPFQNRGTFHQAVELGGSTSVRPAKRPAAIPQGAGGAPLLAVLPLLVLGAGSLRRT